MFLIQMTTRINDIGVFVSGDWHGGLLPAWITYCQVCLFLYIQFVHIFYFALSLTLYYPRRWITSSYSSVLLSPTYRFIFWPSRIQGLSVMTDISTRFSFSSWVVLGVSVWSSHVFFFRSAHVSLRGYNVHINFWLVWVSTLSGRNFLYQVS